VAAPVAISLMASIGQLASRTGVSRGLEQFPAHQSLISHRQILLASTDGLKDASVYSCHL
jgi:hypothetical protein